MGAVNVIVAGTISAAEDKKQQQAETVPRILSLSIVEATSCT